MKTIAGFKETQQRKIVLRLMGGETQQSVADDLKTSRGTIKRINAQMRPLIIAEQVSELKVDEAIEQAHSKDETTYTLEDFSFGDEVSVIYVEEEKVEEVAEEVEPEQPSVQASSFTLVPNSIINIAHGNDVFTADSTHPSFSEIVTLAVEGEFDKAVKLIDVAQSITEYSKGDVTIKGETVLYKGMEVKDGLATRILELMGEGDGGFKKYVAFMARLRENTSYRAVKELFGFISHSDVEITDDGYLIGWKKVKSNYTDCHSGNVENYVGNTIQMPRNMVNEDSNQTCSQGLHVCAWSYLSIFHGSVVLKVKVDPADVVSIPTDYKDSKMRAAKYEILSTVNSNREDIHTPEDYTGKRIISVGEYGNILDDVEK